MIWKTAKDPNEIAHVCDGLLSHGARASCEQADPKREDMGRWCGPCRWPYFKEALARATSPLAGKVYEVAGQAVERYGAEAQWGMVQEECAELISEINRWKRSRSNAHEVAAEVADVLIVLAGAVRMLGDERVILAIEHKIDRLKHKIEAGR